MTDRVAYDEFGMFHENAQEFGIPYAGPPAVRREAVVVDEATGRRVSALVWGESDPEVVLVHGGAQNAHTWDTVALALGRPLVAVDLPGHGHSDVRPDGPDVHGFAADVAAVVEALAPAAAAVVGMSLGGMTTIALLDARPDLVARAFLVDITPGVDGEKAKDILDFVNGPRTFDSFDDLLARTVQFNPTRSEASLRRGILHNAEQLDDGTWRWRHARSPLFEGGRVPLPREDLWQALGRSTTPLALARGMRSQSVVDDADEARLREVRPDALVERFEEAGHSIQGDMPVELAASIDRFLRSPI